MLDTSFNIYRNVHKKLDKIRTLQYSVPEYLHKYVDMVQPTTRFGQIRPERSLVLDTQVLGKANTGLNVTACNATITPACLKALYHLNAPHYIQNTTGGFIGINGFLEEYARFSDLQTFEAEYAPYMKGESFGWTSINGGLLNQTSTDDSVEANLDVQYALSVGYPLSGHYYSTGGLGYLIPDLDQPNPDNNQNEPYLDMLTYLLSLPDSELPTTLTTSYGEDEQSVPEQYSHTVCNMFGQLGARGVSILFSSGDTGVGSACQTNDGKNTTRFLPIFPAACPFVTSVGGTYHIEPESAVYFSSGGFSDRFPRPKYQETAVKEYLHILGNRWEGLYNRTGRGFPDVAAQAYRFHVVDKGQEILVGGTSASSPTFAGVVGLLNAARVAKGMPGMGFLNPWLYEEGYKGLTDIVNGGSTGCTGTDEYSGLKTPVVPYASWNATKGWDPVTGYGTPRFDKLLRLAMKERYRA
ncbi:Tripeptidyl-peptidase sed2 [Zalaria obscura]|uniref:Tripeptidyl-peptidase sed2 n=1 Tax=Zalaria obscura TaxID=2024903 RepID=A0ACC3SQR0_9PEZI